MSGWILYSGNIWYNDFPSTRPYGIYLDGESYTKAADENALNSTNRWYWDNATLRLYIYSLSNLSSYYNSIEVPARSMAVRIANTYYHKYDDLHLKYGYEWTIGFSGTSSNIEVVNCIIEGAGQGASVDLADSVNNITLDNCTIDGGNKSRYNDVIRAIGSNISHCTIKNCEISRGSHSGLLLLYGSHFIIENNEFWSQTDYGRNIDIQGQAGQGGHIIRYNYFHDAHWQNGICLGPDQMNGDGNEVYYNIFANAEYRGFHFWASGSHVIQNIRFYNNIIYGAGNYGLLIPSAMGSGNIFTNNIICNNDPSTHHQVHFNSNASISNCIFDNNCIFNSYTDNSVYDGSQLRTVANRRFIE